MKKFLAMTLSACLMGTILTSSFIPSAANEEVHAAAVDIGSSITWPIGQALPSFASPASNMDAVVVS
ncbi:MAG: hypothetical protein K0R90_1745, partial [Oscillospiraceae bacterium]|nr:hypothetical protein [Oscillospiraceae bacterium]